jgi:DNA-binding response OmpR family regulator
MLQILVVEDDAILRELYCSVLSRSGYKPIPAADGLEAFDRLDDHHIDLIITDVMMPRMDGFAFTRALREARYTTPVLIITARHTPADKQQGFRAGTDDYMVKPIDVNEMLWRVEALLRRSQMVSQRKAYQGKTCFDLDTCSVTRDGVTQYLPQKEFLLLFKLISTPGRTFTRHQILDDVWEGADVDPHTLDVHISKLRERFKENPDFSIVTVRGLGYKAVARE